MRIDSGHIAGLPLGRLKVTGAFVLVFAAITAAQSPRPPDPGEAPLGCGKAEALAQRFFQEREGDHAAVAYAEAYDDTDVLHYQLAFEITNVDTLNHTCTITGSNRIRVSSRIDGLSEFTFRLSDQFLISSAVINDETSPVAVAVDTVSETTRVVTLDRPYNTGEQFTVLVEYSGDTLSTGLGSLDVTTQPLGSPIVASLSEPYYAYTWWPAKHSDVGLPGDNSDKATVEMSVTVPDTFDVPSNGLLQSVDTLSGNRLRYNWSTSNPIATYLVSFAAGTYNRWTESYVYPGGTMPVEFYIYPGRDTPSNRQSWTRVVDMLGVFASLFGEYPFTDEKYGIYNFPFGGGMEHQTMTGQGTFSEITTAHEAAHQWWGDLVTCKTWSDIWLNEGFASYSECLWREFESGTPNHAAYLARVLARKPASVNGSVYVYPEAISVGRIFNTTYTYNKGCWVLHQLRHVVGDAVFFQILADYRSAFADSAATTDDFAGVASAAYGQDLTWFFDQWVYQIGAPAYEWAWTQTNVAGQDILVLNVEQVQVPQYPEVFTAPIEFVIRINSTYDEVATVWNDHRSQWFAVPVSGTVTAVYFDPDQWILRSSETEFPYEWTPGDFDLDGDVDADDAQNMRACITDSGVPLSPGCEPGDFNGDGTVDCDDWAQFGLVWMESGDPAPPAACVGAVPAASAWGAVILWLVILAAGTVVIRGHLYMPRVV